MKIPRKLKVRKPRVKTKVRVDITIDKEILPKAKELAKSQNRTFSNYIETLIMKDIEINKRRS